MSKYIDVAVNLIGSKLEHNLEAVVQNAAKSGVSPLIIIGSHLQESQDAIQICQSYPKQLYCTAGVHPHHATSWNEHSYQQNLALCQSPHVVAIGECGLDYNRNFSPKAEQRKAFIQQLELAVQTQLPVLMHERDAQQDFIAILREYRTKLSGALLHCFTGNHEQLNEYLALDLYLGITGWVCDERRGLELAQAVPHIPDNRLMIETDSPYLLPRSMRPKPKTNINLPEYLPYIANYIAQLRGQDESLLAAQIKRNTEEFFNLGN